MTHWLSIAGSVLCICELWTCDLDLATTRPFDSDIYIIRISILVRNQYRMVRL